MNNCHIQLNTQCNECIVVDGDYTLITSIRWITENTYLPPLKSQDYNNDGWNLESFLKNTWMVNESLAVQSVKKFEWSMTG